MACKVRDQPWKASGKNHAGQFEGCDSQYHRGKMKFYPLKGSVQQFNGHRKDPYPAQFIRLPNLLSAAMSLITRKGISRAPSLVSPYVLVTIGFELLKQTASLPACNALTLPKPLIYSAQASRWCNSHNLGPLTDVTYYMKDLSPFQIIDTTSCSSTDNDLSYLLSSLHSNQAVSNDSDITIYLSLSSVQQHRHDFFFHDS